MAWTEFIDHIGVSFWAMIAVRDEERDRGAEGEALVDAAEDLDGIGLSALGCDRALRRAAAV